jgi:hypothetical protein
VRILYFFTLFSISLQAADLFCLGGQVQVYDEPLGEDNHRMISSLNSLSSDCTQAEIDNFDKSWRPIGFGKTPSEYRERMGPCLEEHKKYLIEYSKKVDAEVDDLLDDMRAAKSSGNEVMLSAEYYGAHTDQVVKELVIESLYLENIISQIESYQDRKACQTFAVGNITIDLEKVIKRIYPEADMTKDLEEWSSHADEKVVYEVLSSIGREVGSHIGRQMGNIKFTALKLTARGVIKGIFRYNAKSIAADLITYPLYGMKYSPEYELKEAIKKNKRKSLNPGTRSVHDWNTYCKMMQEQYKYRSVIHESQEAVQNSVTGRNKMAKFLYEEEQRKKSEQQRDDIEWDTKTKQYKDNTNIYLPIKN